MSLVEIYCHANVCVFVFICRFLSAHLIACVADEDEEYIFPCRPADQRPITQKNLNSFYNGVMEAARKEGVIRRYRRTLAGGKDAADIDTSSKDFQDLLVSFQLYMFEI